MKLICCILPVAIFCLCCTAPLFAFTTIPWTNAIGNSASGGTVVSQRTVTLSGANSYTGGTTVSLGGAVAMNNPIALGGGGLTILDSGGSGTEIFNYTGSGSANMTFLGSIDLFEDNPSDNRITVNNSTTFAAPMVTNSSTVVLNGSSSGLYVFVSPAITPPIALQTLIVNGGVIDASGTITVSAYNTLYGDATTNGGTLTVTQPSILGSGGLVINSGVNSIVLSSGTVVLSNYNFPLTPTMTGTVDFSSLVQYVYLAEADLNGSLAMTDPDFAGATYQVVPVPEPSAVILAGFGVVILGARYLRRLVIG